ncbi:hypothetical protein KP77_14890 [Jeotgalibacillus alimentarius]|uniref:YheE n=2 Tax=Jeotgalibacillus TaxID=157226 RepID=A0A0C2S7Y6_9BACL|nr:MULTISPECIES: DUF5342 family protein [Jeotgalibacillus]KIL50114.1 hypothetical protein KP77_14890 [Jeotgalibacillus alimentarius]MBM7579840.1 hypothetical protein [Jeotgalibacillus terrae]
MIQHFQYQKLYAKDLPGWSFSFTYMGEQVKGIYHKNGKIEWLSDAPEKDQDKVIQQIHDLMLFHVYGD